MTRRLILATAFAFVACGAPPQPQTSTPAARNEPPRSVEEAEVLLEQGREEAWEESLRGIAASGSAEAATAAALLADHYLDEKRWNEAVAALDQAAELNPEIAPWLEVRRIEALAELERWSDAIAVARSVIASAPSSSAGNDARIWLPALHAGSGNREAAATTLRDVLALPVDSFTEAAMVRTSDRLHESGAHDLARNLRWHILQKNPSGAYTERLWSQLRPAADNQSPVLALSPTQALELADRLTRVNRLDQSLDLLDWLASRDASIRSTPAYRWTRLNALFRSRRYTDATEIELKPSDANYVDELMLRGRAYWRSDRNSQFVQEMERVIREFPGTPQAAEAHYQLSRYYIIDDDEPQKSIRYMEQAIEGGAAGGEGENIWSLGWTHYVAGRYDDALKTFERYVRQYPDNDYTMNALFWSAKIHDRNGDTAARNAALRQIVERFPYNYYAYRSREILGISDPPPNQRASGETFPDVSMVPPQLDARLGVVRALLAAGFDADAARELRIVARDFSDNPVAAWHLAQLWSDAGRPLEAMGLLQRNFPAIVRRGAPNVPLRFWQIIYPMPYAEIIRREAERRDLDPYLIASIIRQESAFNPTVVSNAGAAGLMQIMPEELDRITQIGGLPKATRQDLFDPALNIPIGAAEFRQKLDEWNGDIDLAIASYNAGASPVRQWVERYGLEDRDYFIESIPYAETRLYVKIINRNLNEYRRVWGP